MPKKLERCVNQVSKSIKPKKGSKKSAAWAVCTKAVKKGRKGK